MKEPDWKPTQERDALAQFNSSNSQERPRRKKYYNPTTRHAKSTRETTKSVPIAFARCAALLRRAHSPADLHNAKNLMIGKMFFQPFALCSRMGRSLDKIVSSARKLAARPLEKSRGNFSTHFHSNLSRAVIGSFISSTTSPTLCLAQAEIKTTQILQRAFRRALVLVHTREFAQEINKCKAGSRVVALGRRCFSLAIATSKDADTQIGGETVYIFESPHSAISHSYALPQATTK